MYVTGYSDCLVSVNHSHVCDCYSDCLVSMNHSHVCDCYSDCLVSVNHFHHLTDVTVSKMSGVFTGLGAIVMLCV